MSNRRQLSHAESPFSRRQFPIILICDQVSSALNQGALMRLADAFGLKKLYFCGATSPLSKQFKRTSRSAEQYVDFEICDSADALVSELKQQKHRIICLEICKDSRPINELNLKFDLPIALVVGAENFGIDENLLQQADHIVHIEMYGQNSSMNVAQATGIALYELSQGYLSSSYI